MRLDGPQAEEQLRRDLLGRRTCHDDSRDAQLLRVSALRNSEDRPARRWRSAHERRARRIRRRPWWTDPRRRAAAARGAQPFPLSAQLLTIEQAGTGQVRKAPASCEMADRGAVAGIGRLHCPRREPRSTLRFPSPNRTRLHVCVPVGQRRLPRRVAAGQLGSPLRPAPAAPNQRSRTTPGRQADPCASGSDQPRKRSSSRSRPCSTVARPSARPGPDPAKDVVRAEKITAPVRACLNHRGHRAAALGPSVGTTRSGPQPYIIP